MSDQSGSIAPVTIRRGDYAPPAYGIDTLDLSVTVLDDRVEVRAVLQVVPAPDTTPGTPLVLDGEDLTTQGVSLNGTPLDASAYTVSETELTILAPPAQPFRLETVVTIDPWTNTSLSGLYLSGGLLCTQCEAEGYRRITWYPDRPDVMARFRVTIDAPQAAYPVLLSNGNLVEQGASEPGRHRAVWEDPFPKPSYLFALVAGDLALVEDAFTTRSGRTVALRFWVEHGNQDQAGHAMVSLQKAFAWDEQVYGLEYDLGVFNVVAVSHFNMGAMENKSLNIFNSKYVLAKRETATDDDFAGVESVIAHEYFHNWTGNRVTCRDWFQLTLKEGLTVFRDQEFSADQGSRALARIEDARYLRVGQFPEDNGPMAHPIRPEAYEEINNFYTSTVYEKGAEVIRMIHTIIGATAFRAGMDLYFARHDGHAVTCEDFVAAMEDASGVSLDQFRLWYSQAGTPRITASWTHDAASKRLSLTLAQTIPPTPGQPSKNPMHIPVRMGLLDPAGRDIPLRMANEETAQGTTRVLHLTQATQSFDFEDVPAGALPSLFRSFSAPVIVDAPYQSADLAFLMGHDSDLFNRWDAGQSLATRYLLDLTATLAKGDAPVLDDGFADAWGRVLDQSANDPAFVAEALGLPATTALGERMALIDVDGLVAARRFTHEKLAERYRAPLLALRQAAAKEGAWSLDPKSVGQRRLANHALGLLALIRDPSVQADAERQFAQATCMSNQLSALAALVELGPQAAQPALDAFLAQWKDEGLVVNKWFGMQTQADWDDVLDRVKALTSHPMFDWNEPNKIYALLGGFTGNFKHFHRADGTGYAFLADQVIRLNATNPQVASRMVKPLIRWRRYEPGRQSLMQSQLLRIQSEPALSRDVAELVGKALSAS